VRRCDLASVGQYSRANASAISGGAFVTGVFSRGGPAHCSELVGPSGISWTRVTAVGITCNPIWSRAHRVSCAGAVRRTSGPRPGSAARASNQAGAVEGGSQTFGENRHRLQQQQLIHGVGLGRKPDLYESGSTRGVIDESGQVVLTVREGAHHGV